MNTNNKQWDFELGEPTITSHNGKPYIIRTNYELIGDRWEGFVSMEPVKETESVQ